MEVGEIPASLPSLTKINKELQRLIKVNVEQNLRTILLDIADKYRLSKNELMQNYLSDDKIVIKEDESSKTTKRKRKKIPLYERCTARTSSGDQCSRRKKKESEFCGSHSNSRNFGIIKISATNLTDSTNATHVTNSTNSTNSSSN